MLKRFLTALTLVCASAATKAFADADPTILSTSEALPEPGSLALFALAMLGVWAVKRHNDRK